jgi:predicted metal-binding membrane protein
MSVSGARDVRERSALWIAGGVTLALAWIFLVRAQLDAGAGGSLHAPPGAPSLRPLLLASDPHAAEPQSLLLALLMWQAMMAAMTIPVLAPWVDLLAAMRPAGARRGPLSAGLLFAAGYFTVWTAYSAAGAAAQSGLYQAPFLTGDHRATAAGLALAAAGLFQFTTLKRRCLAHCRSPLSYFLARWNNGPAGEFRMGLGHGVYCVACCWPLMTLALVVGAMNLIWMAALTLVMVLEQLAPGGHRIAKGVGAALVACGVWAAFG